MTREEFLERLRSVEWNDIEFKEATWASPKNALPTVSAFANTRGGYLVYGVTEAGGSLSISGVIDVEKIQSDFLGITRDMQKVSVALPISEELLSFPEGTVICFYIPELGFKFQVQRLI
jgi:ATP-dependent DNA helicase RecG